jgi:hypothetical protein
MNAEDAGGKVWELTVLHLQGRIVNGVATRT